MASDSTISFPPFRLDLTAGRLWRGADEIALTPRAFDVLRVLSAQPGRLVSKEELRAAVWGDTRVSPDTLRSTLRELRRALADDAAAPTIIETVHGRGYRFVGGASADGARPGPVLFGREAAFREVGVWSADAMAGHRQVAFVVGEPGIGKTVTTRACFQRLRREGAICVHGQCVDRYGESEPYLPILEALGRLCRQEGGERWRDVLERHAPTWLVEIPGLLDADERRRLATAVVRVNRDRMLRELAAAVETIATQQPLVLLLEDLHWSDGATLDAIDALARRAEPARLLVIGTHRPVVPAGGGDVTRLAALRAELHLHGLCRDLVLPPLQSGDVRAYLDTRFPGAESLDAYVYGRCEGNPLIMVGYADQLVREGFVVETDNGWRLDGDVADLAIPDGVRHMVEYQIARLAPDAARVLESASVAGHRLEAALVADADPSLAAPDEVLARLARTRELIDVDAGQLRFVHALYQELLYERVAPERRRTLHRAFGEAIERAHGADGASVAAELAMHFERAGDAERAVPYLREAAELAIQRSAHDAAVSLLRRALALLAPEADVPARRGAEFGVLARLGTCLTMTKGYVDPEVREVFARAFELAAEIADDVPELMTVLAGLCGYYELRGEHASAAELTLTQLRLAERTRDPNDRMVASLSRSIVCFSVGEYAEAAEHLDVCLRHYDPRAHDPVATPSATDVGVQALGHASLVLGGLGRLDEAMAHSRRSIAQADRDGHVPSRILARFYAMLFEQFLRNAGKALGQAQTCLELSTKHGFPYYVPAALVVSGWAMAQDGRAAEGAAQASQGIEILKDAGAVLGQPLFLAMLADAYRRAGDVTAGLAAVNDGLGVVDATGEIASESFLHWAQAELLATRADGTDSWVEIEASLGRAVAAAERCGARMQKLGPATSLARAWRVQGRIAEASQLLEESLRGFASAADAPVLRTARDLLTSLRAE